MYLLKRYIVYILSTRQNLKQEDNMINKQQVLNWIKNTQIPISTISSNTGVSRGTIYKWIGGTNIKDETSKKILFVYKKEIAKTKPKDRSQLTLMEKIVKGQDDLILLQQEQINNLKKQMKQVHRGTYKQDYPDTFKEMANMVQSAQAMWNWNFCKSPTPMSIADSKTGIIRNVNSSCLEQLEYERSDMIGKCISDFIHPDDIQDFEQSFKQPERIVEYRILKGNKEYCLCRITAKVFKSNGSSYSVAQIKCMHKGYTGCSDIE